MNHFSFKNKCVRNGLIMFFSGSNNTVFYVTISKEHATNNEKKKLIPFNMLICFNCFVCVVSLIKHYAAAGSFKYMLVYLKDPGCNDGFLKRNNILTNYSTTLLIWTLLIPKHLPSEQSPQSQLRNFLFKEMKCIHTSKYLCQRAAFSLIVEY
jgi:hypothetical protein